MGLFSKSKGDTMSKKKSQQREPSSDQVDTGGEPSTIETEAAFEGDERDPDEIEGTPTSVGDPTLQQEGETDAEYKERRTIEAKREITAAEQQTAALFAQQAGESDADYQSRIDDQLLQGSHPAPLDPTYTLPETPTVDDQRAYLVHYALATEDEAAELTGEEVALKIAQHGQDLQLAREQTLMQSSNAEASVLPVNPTLQQLQTFVAVKGLAKPEEAARMDLQALSTIVQSSALAALAVPAGAESTVDLALVPQPELSELPYGGEPPRYYVVLEDKNLNIDGMATQLRATAQINDRSYDIEFLKRMGVKLIETVAPVPSY